MLAAVIFDMDGLLIDSEPLWVRAEMQVFGEVGVALSEEDCALTKGLRTDDVIAYWHARRAWPEPSPAEVQARLIQRVADLVRAEGKGLPGVEYALALAKKNGPIALASSSPTSIIHATLARLGLDNAFDVVQSAEHESHGKPHPGVFLRTAERLGVPAPQCLVLEDSLMGVIAAKAARMACVAIPPDYPNQDARFVLADRVIGSLEQLDLTVW